MGERHVVLRHLDVTQPHPFLRLWERWGLGEGGGEWVHAPPPPRLGWDRQPTAHAREHVRRWRRPPHPPPPALDPHAPLPLLATRDARWSDHDRPAHPGHPEGIVHAPESADHDHDSSPIPTTPPSRRARTYTADQLRAVAAAAGPTPPLDVPALRDIAAAEATVPSDPLDDVRAALAAKKAAVLASRATPGDEPASRGDERAPPPSPSPPPSPPPPPLRYAAEELRAWNVGCDAAPPGFVADAGWSRGGASPSARASKGAASKKPKSSSSRAKEAARGAAAAAASAAAARDAAELETARAMAVAALRVDSSAWSIWATPPRRTTNVGDNTTDEAENAESADGRGSDPRPALFAEASYLADVTAVAASLRAKAEAEEVEARRRETARLKSEPSSPVDAIGFAPGALTAFAVAATDAAKSLAPYAVPTSTLGLAFGTWTRVDGDGSNAWRGAVAFLQPWDGEPARLVEWLARRDEEAREGTRGDEVKEAREKGVGIRPMGWVMTTNALEPRVSEDVRDAFRAVAGTGTGTGGDAGTGTGGDDGPPPAAAMLVSLDATVTALAAKGAGGGARVEVFDLRTERALDFEVEGVDDDDPSRT